jgi:Cu2+-containing amine oxidase
MGVAELCFIVTEFAIVQILFGKIIGQVLRWAVSGQVDGNLIKWQKWQIRVSFNWREGLVLHNVGYEDEGRLRPIMHRASIAEMAVPYAEAQVLAANQPSV